MTTNRKNKDRAITSQESMPGKEAAVHAAYITSQSVKIAALITALGAIFVAFLSNYEFRIRDRIPPPITEKKRFVARVRDKTTEKNIKGAEVSLEGDGVRTITYTDSEGVLSIPLDDPNKEIRIRIVAKGYEDYDRRVTPSEIHKMQELWLEAVSSPSPSPTGSPSAGRTPRK